MKNEHYLGKVVWNKRAVNRYVSDGEIVKSRPIASEYLVYEGKHPALIDRELYLPKEWTGSAAAVVPEDIEFATKPRLAQRMIERALTAGSPGCWATRSMATAAPLAGTARACAGGQGAAVGAGQGAIQVPAKDRPNLWRAGAA